MWVLANKAHVKRLCNTRHLSCAVSAGKESVMPLELWLFSSIFTLTTMKTNASISIHHQIHSRKTMAECSKHHEPSNEISPLSALRCSNTTEDKINYFSLDTLSTFVAHYKKNNKHSTRRSDQGRPLSDATAGLWGGPEANWQTNIPISVSLWIVLAWLKAD